MSLRIFVGNLSYQVTDEDLHESFAPFGEIAFSRVILDRDSGKSRGFGFVEFLQEEAGKEAIKSLANKELKGRPLRLREAEPRGDGPSYAQRPGPAEGEGRGESAGPGTRKPRDQDSAQESQQPRPSRGRREHSEDGTGTAKEEAQRRRIEKKTHTRRPEEVGTRHRMQQKPVEKERGGARNRFLGYEDDEEDDVDLFGSYHEDEDFDLEGIEGVEIGGSDLGDEGDEGDEGEPRGRDD